MLLNLKRSSTAAVRRDPNHVRKDTCEDNFVCSPACVAPTGHQTRGVTCECMLTLVITLIADKAKDARHDVSAYNNISGCDCFGRIDSCHQEILHEPSIRLAAQAHWQCNRTDLHVERGEKNNINSNGHLDHTLQCDHVPGIAVP